MNSITKVPTKLATLMLANAIESHNTTLAVVRLNKTSVSMNFQNAGTVGTRPTSGYTIPPKTSGGTRRSGKISNRIYITLQVNKVTSAPETKCRLLPHTFDEKYVKDE